MISFWEKLVVRSYEFWCTRRGLLIFIVLALSALIGISCFKINLSSDVKAMLPDGKDGLIEDFELLSCAPMSKNVLIALESSTPAADELSQTADKIISEVSGEYFTKVIAGISQQQKLNLFNWYFDHLGALATVDDLNEINDKLQPENLDIAMQDNLKSLLSPESIFLKDIIRKDPIGLRELLASKFKCINLVGSINPNSDYFMKADNKHLLIIADTVVSISDYKGSREMLEFLDTKLESIIPDNISYKVVCGHRYTVANSETIQQDLRKVLVLSSVGLLVVFFCFLRHWSALLVYFVPLFSMLAGLVACSMVFKSVSAITLGFGAVLLGISADFGLHLFYGMQNMEKQAQDKLRELVKPLTFCALTTTSVFVVLLFSAMQIQRQLAVFSIAGILTAYLVSLLVLPHLVPKRQVVSMLPLSLAKGGKATAIIWVAVLVICMFPAFKVGFDGNIRNIGMRPDSVVNDETSLREEWGGVRDRAMCFIFGDDTEQALEGNDQFYSVFSSSVSYDDYLNIAPLLPSLKQQDNNIMLWQDFWQTNIGLEQLGQSIFQSGEKYGFGKATFTPFLEMLKQQPQSFTVSDLENIGILDMVEPFIAKTSDGRTAVISMLPDDDKVLNSVITTMPTAKIISNRQVGDKLSRTTSKDFIRFFSISLIVILLLIVVLFFHKAMIFCAVLPVVSGLLVMFGIMGGIGMDYNIFNVVASILVIGLSVDYGIFAVFGSVTDLKMENVYAVLVSGLTTLVGFGSLLVANHPSMFSIGLTVSSGILPALLCAVTLVPYAVSMLVKR